MELKLQKKHNLRISPSRRVHHEGGSDCHLLIRCMSHTMDVIAGCIISNYMGVSINEGTPKLMLYKGKSQSKMDDWGVPPFMETHILYSGIGQDLQLLSAGFLGHGQVAECYEVRTAAASDCGLVWDATAVPNRRASSLGNQFHAAMKSSRFSVNSVSASQLTWRILQRATEGPLHIFLPPLIPISWPYFFRAKHPTTPAMTNWIYWIYWVLLTTSVSLAAPAEPLVFNNVEPQFGSSVGKKM